MAVLNFSHLTLIGSQPYLEFLALVVVGDIAEQVGISALIHRYIGLFWLFVEIMPFIFQM